MSKAPSTAPVMTGYALSVYCRSIRIAMAEKGVAYDYVECDPFDPSHALRLMQEHPFGRVPVLKHGDFHLYETAAILGYVDAAFEGPALTPMAPRSAARMRQVMAIADNYAYRPLVRQAFSHAVYRPLVGEPAVAAQAQAGLRAGPRVLDALEEIAREGLVLIPDQVCLASCHLWPMLQYFAMVPKGQEMLAQRDALSAWIYAMGRRGSAQATTPDLNQRGEA